MAFWRFNICYWGVLEMGQVYDDPGIFFLLVSRYLTLIQLWAALSTITWMEQLGKQYQKHRAETSNAGLLVILWSPPICPWLIHSCRWIIMTCIWQKQEQVMPSLHSSSWWGFQYAMRILPDAHVCDCSVACINTVWENVESHSRWFESSYLFPKVHLNVVTALICWKETYVVTLDLVLSTLTIYSLLNSFKYLGGKKRTKSLFLTPCLNWAYLICLLVPFSAYFFGWKQNWSILVCFHVASENGIMWIVNTGFSTLLLIYLLVLYSFLSIQMLTFSLLKITKLYFWQLVFKQGGCSKCTWT